MSRTAIAMGSMVMAAGAVIGLGVARGARTEDGPNHRVLVELFESQG